MSLSSHHMKSSLTSTICFPSPFHSLPPPLSLSLSCPFRSGMSRASAEHVLAQAAELAEGAKLLMSVCVGTYDVTLCHLMLNSYFHVTLVLRQMMLSHLSIYLIVSFFVAISPSPLLFISISLHLSRLQGESSLEHVSARLNHSLSNSSQEDLSAMVCTAMRKYSQYVSVHLIYYYISSSRPFSPHLNSFISSVTSFIRHISYLPLLCFVTALTHRLCP